MSDAQKKFRVYINFVTMKAIEVDASSKEEAREIVMTMPDSELYDRSDAIDADFYLVKIKEVQ